MGERWVTVRYMEHIVTFVAYTFRKSFWESPWGAIAMSGPTVVHVCWYSAYLLKNASPILIEVFNHYCIMIFITPAIIAVCLVVFRVPVRSIARDTGAVAMGFVVGDVIAFALMRAFVLMLPADSDINFAIHVSFGAIFMAVCVPAAVVMFSLAVAFKRGDEKVPGTK